MKFITNIFYKHDEQQRSQYMTSLNSRYFVIYDISGLWDQMSHGWPMFVFIWKVIEIAMEQNKDNKGKKIFKKLLSYMNIVILL